MQSTTFNISENRDYDIEAINSCDGDLILNFSGMINFIGYNEDDVKYFKCNASSITLNNIGNGNISFGGSSFLPCINLVKLTINNDGDLFFGNSVFGGCTLLETVEINNKGCGRIRFGDSAFDGCSVLSSINLNSSPYLYLGLNPGLLTSGILYPKIAFGRQAFNNISSPIRTLNNIGSGDTIIGGNSFNYFNDNIPPINFTLNNIGTGKISGLSVEENKDLGKYVLDQLKTYIPISQ